MKRLIVAVMLLLPLCATASEAGKAKAATYNECTAVTLWIVAAKHVNNGGVPEDNIAKIPEGWTLVDTVANVKYPMMILCR